MEAIIWEFSENFQLAERHGENMNWESLRFIAAILIGLIIGLSIARSWSNPFRRFFMGLGMMAFSGIMLGLVVLAAFAEGAIIGLSPTRLVQIAAVNAIIFIVGYIGAKTSEK